MGRTCHVTTSTFSGAIIQDLYMKPDISKRQNLLIKCAKLNADRPYIKGSQNANSSLGIGSVPLLKRITS